MNERMLNNMFGTLFHIEWNIISGSSIIAINIKNKINNLDGISMNASINITVKTNNILNIFINLIKIFLQVSFFIQL